MLQVAQEEEVQAKVVQALAFVLVVARENLIIPELEYANTLSEPAVQLTVISDKISLFNFGHFIYEDIDIHLPHLVSHLQNPPVGVLAGHVAVNFVAVGR